MTTNATIGSVSDALVCPSCRGALTAHGDPRGADSGGRLRCAACAVDFPVDHHIADFSGGAYFDSFDGDAPDLSVAHCCGLCNEETTARARIEDFYLPLLRDVARRLGRSSLRVLDSGCGNGLSVETLRDAGIDAWGNDLSQLRQWQWRALPADVRQRLMVADTCRLPFPDGFFDVALSSGVLEHVGVDEIGGEVYEVTPKPDRNQRRLAFLAELSRVVAADGLLCLDFPNGAFPIDFWHGTVPGGARFHPLDEGFLPKVAEIRDYFARIGKTIDARFGVEALSPHRRLRMRQVGGHWYGRLLRAPMQAFLWAMDSPLLRPLAATGLNPYLVLRVQRV